MSNNGLVRNAQTGHILSPGVSQGYHYVALYKDRLRKNKQVHRLVAESFLSNPHNHPIINHIDEDRKNNNVDNLEWCDYSYNNTYGMASINRSQTLKGHIPWNKGKRMTPEYRKNVSEGMKRFYNEHKASCE